MSVEDMTNTDVQLPTSAFASDARSPAGGEEHRPHVRISAAGKGNLLLACMFAAGIGCVWLMRLQGGPSIASAEQSETQTHVDIVLSTLAETTAARKRTARNDKAVINTFYYEARHRQIPPASLSGNPFIYTPAPAASLVTMPKKTAPSAPKPKKVTEYAQALAEAQKLSLQTVLTGSKGATAMISNNLLTEGQVIRGWTVSSIRPKEVVLRWKDKTYSLRLP